jgi:rhodanese-related sulfurtransferase
MLECCQKLITEARASVNELSWAEAEAAGIEGGWLIDVREPQEFAQGSVPGAINIPRGLLEFSIDKQPCFKGLDEQALMRQQMLLFCGTGGRSALAAQSLSRLGFSQAYSVRGGLELRD